MRKAAAILALLLPVALAGCTPSGRSEAQSWRTVTSARQVWDREPMEVRVQYGAGTLRIEPAEPPTLYELELRYDENVSTPVVEFDESARRLRLGATSAQGGRRRLAVRDGATADVRLTREVPLDLSLEFGAGSANIRLGGVSVRRLSLSTGASETRVTFDAPNPIDAERVSIDAGAADLRVTGLGNVRAERIDFQGGVGSTVLDFSGDWARGAAASVQMGVGAITFRIPRTLGVRIDRSSFLTSFSAPGLERQGNSYYSANWDGARHRLTIDVSAALGSIDVQWID
jgi:hypothetical protein